MLRSSLHLLLVVATSAVMLVACGSDTTSTTSTGTGGGTTSATGTGGASTSSGTGGTASTSTATGTGTSTGTGMVMSACTNAADTAVIAAKDVKAITTMCGQENGGAEPATKNCIKTGTGLSSDCTSCYSGEVDCVRDHCLGVEGKCLTMPDAQLCLDCRKMYCVPAFEACSGLKSM